MRLVNTIDVPIENQAKSKKHLLKAGTHHPIPSQIQRVMQCYQTKSSNPPGDTNENPNPPISPQSLEKRKCPLKPLKILYPVRTHTEELEYPPRLIIPYRLGNIAHAGRDSITQVKHMPLPHSGPQLSRRRPPPPSSCVVSLRGMNTGSGGMKGCCVACGVYSGGGGDDDRSGENHHGGRTGRSAACGVYRGGGVGGCSYPPPRLPSSLPNAPNSTSSATAAAEARGG